MSKKEKSVLLAAAGLLVLIVLLLVLVLTDTDKKGSDSDSSGTAVSSGVSSEKEYTDVLIDTDIKTKSLKVENTEDSFTLLKDKATGEYYFPEYPNINLYEKFIDYLWNTTSYMGANQRVTMPDGSEPEDLSQYGFDSPIAKVTITYEDDSVKRFDVGKALPGDEGIYYVRVNGTEGIYAVTLHLGFFENRLYFFDDTIIDMPMDENNNYLPVVIDNIVLSGKNYPQPVKVSLNPDSDNAYSAFYESPYIINSPEKVTPRSKYFGDLVYQLKQVIVNKAVIFAPTPEQLKQYGFNNPAAVVSYKYNNKDIKLIAGNTNETDTYLMMEGINAIFSIQTSYCTNWSQGNYEKIREASVFPRAFAAFKEFTLKSDSGKSYKFEVTRKLSNAKTDYEVTLNGKKIDMSNYQKFISNMTLSQVVEYNAVPSPEPPALTINISYFEDSGLAGENIQFISSGTRRYVCKINGNGSTSVSSTYIEKLLGDCEKLLKGENINTI